MQGISGLDTNLNYCWLAILSITPLQLKERLHFFEYFDFSSAVLERLSLYNGTKGFETRFHETWLFT